MSLEVPDLLNSLKSSADTPDAEFSGSISPFTAVDGSSGTVSLLAGSGSGLYDVSTRSGWVLFQVGTSSGDGVSLKQDYTLPDGSCIVAPVSFALDWAAAVSNNEIWLGIGVNDDDSGVEAGAAGQTVMTFVDADSSGWRILSHPSMGVNHSTQTHPAPDLVFLRIDRDGLTYHTFYSQNGFAWTYLGSKTLSTAANNVWLFAECRATMANRIVVGCPWFREGTALAADPFPL